MHPVTIRSATPRDDAALDELAALDSSRPPKSPVLVAEVGDELWAAVSLQDLSVVSDPFRPSGELTFVLVERARQLTRRQRRRTRRLALPRPRLAA